MLNVEKRIQNPGDPDLGPYWPASAMGLISTGTVLPTSSSANPLPARPALAPREAVYVVFGHRSSFDATFQFSSLDGTNGFRIEAKVSENLRGLQ
jgi:hypothetical protein